MPLLFLLLLLFLSVFFLLWLLSNLVVTHWFRQAKKTRIRNLREGTLRIVCEHNNRPRNYQTDRSFIMLRDNFNCQLPAFFVLLASCIKCSLQLKESSLSRTQYYYRLARRTKTSKSWFHKKLVCIIIEMRLTPS